MQTASTVGEKSFVRRTPSTEYWDEVPPQSKIQSMATYLEDVGEQRDTNGSKADNVYSSKPYPPPSYQKA